MAWASARRSPASRGLKSGSSKLFFGATAALIRAGLSAPAAERQQRRGTRQAIEKRQRPAQRKIAQRVHRSTRDRPTDHTAQATEQGEGGSHAGDGGGAEAP